MKKKDLTEKVLKDQGIGIDHADLKGGVIEIAGADVEAAYAAIVNLSDPQFKRVLKIAPLV